jgi:phosphopantetheinyl transferase
MKRELTTLDSGQEDIWLTMLSRVGHGRLRTYEALLWGRPYISRPAQFSDIQFNLSHTEGLVACGIGNGCLIPAYLA